ncbi:MAG: AAA family ATPase [Flavobacterium sp.]|uniref:AAA family ATPase n=1 Tax=Flavobacterium sp. TaxID=239 RepID=UPI00391AFA8C
MFIELEKGVENVLEINNKDKSVYYFDGSKLFLDTKTVIGEFKKINFFVGSNNSGKSRFLRGLLKYERINLSPTKIIFKDLKDNINITDYNLNSGLIRRLNNYDEFGPHFNEFHKRFNSMTSNDVINNFHIYSKIFVANNILNESVELMLKDSLTPINKNFFLRIKEFSLRLKALEEHVNFVKANFVQNKVYIPTLRNLTRNSNFSADTFDVVVKENYLIDKNVFTGLKLYDELNKSKGSPIAERKKVQEFERFLSKTFFENKKVEITASLVKPATILFSIDDHEYPIFDIGDGIQMLIVLLFPIFTANENTWFFIEEPETHLHPGLQRIFIETLLNDSYLKSKNLRYFFTTHSNHFLDLSLVTNDISIFQFQKKNQDKFNIKCVKSDKETLDLLGVKNSSVLMANSSIWVEGPTDRKYITKFLKLYCENTKTQNLKEDIDFAFFEYGGNLIEHYLFDNNFDEVYTEEEVRDKINAFALSNKIYLLADNDNASGKKLIRRKKLEAISKEQIYFKYQNTNYREIENLLPSKVIKEFLVELVKSASDVEKIEKINFNRNDYLSIGLGEFIVGLFEKNNIKDFKNFKDPSGTLKSSYKIKLCDYVVNSNYSYEDMIYENKQLDKIINDLFIFIST